MAFDFPWVRMINPQPDEVSPGKLILACDPTEIHLNHNQDINAGALFSLAEMAGMGVVVTSLGDRANDTYVVIKRGVIDFKSRARGRVRACASLADSQLERVHSCGIDAEGIEEIVAVEILDAIIERRGMVDLKEGARKLARHLSRAVDMKIHSLFVYNAFARTGWMVPNQYWTPGALSPMAIMGKYYMYYGKDFMPPRELGRLDAERLKKELILDNTGICRFHRAWAEEMIPEIIGSLYGLEDEFLRSISKTATRINARNSSVFWESERNIDFIYRFLKRKRDIDGCDEPDLHKWIKAFETDKNESALSFWYEIHKGVMESLREFE